MSEDQVKQYAHVYKDAEKIEGTLEIRKPLAHTSDFLHSKPRMNAFQAMFLHFGLALLVVVVIIAGATWFIIKALTKPARRPCPHCAEQILLDAKVCPHCQREVKPIDVFGT